jgi:ATP-dependent helicase IRC3
MNISLREYQKEALNTVLHEFHAGVSRQLIALPTGSGKTLLMSGIAKHLNKKTLIIAHRQELISQTVEKLQLFWPEVDVGVCMGDRQEVHNQIVVGSVQSCYRPQRLAKLKEQGFSIMMIDEAHHAVSDSYQLLINELGFNKNKIDKLLIGVSATIDRDGLGNIFEKVVFSRSIGTMIRANYLSPVVGRKILTNLSLSSVKISNGDFQISDLSELVNTPERNNFIIEKYKEYSPDRKTIAFCCDVQHCKDLSEAFKSQGIDSRAVWGDMLPEDRLSTLREFKSGKFQVVTSCGILTEGYDEPSVNAIIMARPTKSASLYIQCVGRGLRLWPGKQDCLVLDFSDKYNNLDGVMSLTATIPEALQIKEEIDQIEQDQEIDKRPKIEIFSNCDREFDILGCARFIWIQIDDEWSLQDDERNEIVMSPEANGYVATLYFVDGSSQKIVKNPLPLEYCSGVCEDFARRHLKISFADQGKPWMMANAAMTQGQTDFLQKNKIDCKAMNRGQASIEIRKIVALKNKQRRALSNEPMSDKQKYFLINNGVDPAKMNKLSAMQAIAKIKQNQQVKYG